MNKLLESYKTLLHLGTQVLFFIEVHHTYTENEEYLNNVKFKGHYANIPFAKAISGSLQNYSMIIAVSFFDEYNELLTPSEIPAFADRIVRLKTINKPVLDRLKKWKDFKDFRNHILAHPLRVHKKSIFSKNSVPITFSVPHSNSEVILLAELMKIITTNIWCEFPEIHDKLDFKDTILSKLNFENNEVNVSEELEAIWSQIKAIKEKL